MSGFTNKEMLQRVLDKLDGMESKLNNTHEMACLTNGKVKLHTKIIWGIAGLSVTAFLTVVGWIIKYL